MMTDRLIFVRWLSSSSGVESSLFCQIEIDFRLLLAASFFALLLIKKTVPRC
jgi:hypothetical protein